MKYIVCAAPMILCNEILSLICLCGLLVCVLYDLIKHAPKTW